jgi:adenine phosphoribosyltransferase
VPRFGQALWRPLGARSSASLAKPVTGLPLAKPVTGRVVRFVQMVYDAARIKDLVRDVPDFPKPGVTFKDITPLLADAEGLATCIDALSDRFSQGPVDKVIGVEARGFIVAGAVAYRLGAGFVPVRKKGKLPWRIHSDTYELEYGVDTLEVHADAVQEGERVLILDDVLATGGTAAATRRLVGILGGEVVGLGCVLELGFLGGRQRLGGLDVEALVSYE